MGHGYCTIYLNLSQFFSGLPFLLQVANFEYVNEEDALAAAAVEEAEKEVKAKREAELAEGPGRVQFWDSLLKDRAVEVQVEEVQELGKGKRSRKQVHLVLVSHLFMLSFVLIVLCIFLSVPHNQATENSLTIF